MLLRRLSLSRADKPRKRYEGYDTDAKKDNGGLDHWSVGNDGAGQEDDRRPSTIGVAWGRAQGFVGRCATRAGGGVSSRRPGLT